MSIKYKFGGYVQYQLDDNNKVRTLYNDARWSEYNS